MSVPPGPPRPPGPPNPPSSPGGPFGAPQPSPFGPGPLAPPTGFGPQTNLAHTPGWLPQETPPASSGRKTALVVGLIVALVVAGIVVILETRDDGDSVRSANSQAKDEIDDGPLTAPTRPDITIPNLTIPSDLSIPDITVPFDNSIPALPPIPTAPTIPGQVTPQTNATNPGGATETTVAVSAVNLFAGTQAADVITEFAAARDAAPLRILQVLLYPEYAFAHVQDPGTPANVDEYEWRGSVGSPVPVRLSGEGDLETNLFSDTDVNWAVIPMLVESAVAQIPIEGAEVSHISIKRNLPFTADVQIRVFVSGTRTNGYLDADAQGNVIAVDQG